MALDNLSQSFGNLSDILAFSRDEAVILTAEWMDTDVSL